MLIPSASLSEEAPRFRVWIDLAAGGSPPEAPFFRYKALSPSLGSIFRFFPFWNIPSPTVFPGRSFRSRAPRSRRFPKDRAAPSLSFPFLSMHYTPSFPLTVRFVLTLFFPDPPFLSILGYAFFLDSFWLHLSVWFSQLLEETFPLCPFLAIYFPRTRPTFPILSNRVFPIKFPFSRGRPSIKSLSCGTSTFRSSNRPSPRPEYKVLISIKKPPFPDLRRTPKRPLLRAGIFLEMMSSPFSLQTFPSST